MNQLTHTDSDGKAKMVDVGHKSETHRTARAYAEISMSTETFNAIQTNTIVKGDVLTVAKIAGIQAAKKTFELIPLCHNIPISQVDISFEMDEVNSKIKIFSTANTNAKTGIEMEAIVAASNAAITIYDMCKAMDKSMTISNIMLISKTGGKSGDFFNPKYNELNV